VSAHVRHNPPVCREGFPAEGESEKFESLAPSNACTRSVRDVQPRYVAAITRDTINRSLWLLSPCSHGATPHRSTRERVLEQVFIKSIFVSLVISHRQHSNLVGLRQRILWNGWNLEKFTRNSSLQMPLRWVISKRYPRSLRFLSCRFSPQLKGELLGQNRAGDRALRSHLDHHQGTGSKRTGRVRARSHRAGGGVGEQEQVPAYVARPQAQRAGVRPVGKPRKRRVCDTGSVGAGLKVPEVPFLHPVTQVEPWQREDATRLTARRKTKQHPSSPGGCTETGRTLGRVRPVSSIGFHARTASHLRGMHKKAPPNGRGRRANRTRNRDV